MITNEERAEYGAQAITTVAREVNVYRVEPAKTALVDVLAYVAHFCDRLGLDPRKMFDDGIRSYEGDSDDGPKVAVLLDPSQSLEDQYV